MNSYQNKWWKKALRVIGLGTAVFFFNIHISVADQAQVLCTRSTNGAFTNCVPVSTTAPLPVKSN